MGDGLESQEAQKDEHGMFIIDPWDNEFLDVEFEAKRFHQLMQIFCAALYLRIQGLVDVISRISSNRLNCD